MQVWGSHPGESDVCLIGAGREGCAAEHLGGSSEGGQCSGGTPEPHRVWASVDSSAPRGQVRLAMRRYPRVNDDATMAMMVD